MATKASTTKDKVEIPWPKSLVVEGVLSFPITSEEDIDALQEWRIRRKIPAPQFPDKIGANLLLNQAQYDKTKTYLTDTYLPFVKELWDLTNGAKGIEPEAVDTLLEQALAEKWTVTEGRKEKPNLPIRYLTDKDKENLPDDDEYVYKIKFSGPYEKPFPKKAIIKDEEGRQIPVDLKHIELPSGADDPDALWWGARWHFRTSLKFNAFEAASLGVTAYGAALYLLPHFGLPVSGGGNSDADVVDDGDDWTDE